MIALTAIRLPALTPEGDPLGVPPERWALRPDMRAGVIRADTGASVVNFDLRRVLAVEVLDEREERAVGKTLGRMALTGIGASMMTHGRRGGMGAGLLDLSVRGVETRTVVTGNLVWPNTAIFYFRVQGPEIQQLIDVVPAAAFEAEAVEEAGRRVELLGRMKADGPRALVEMAREVVQVAGRVRDLYAEAERGETFTVRDAARQEAEETDERLGTMRVLCRALIADVGMPFRELVASLPEGSDISLLLGAAPPSAAPSSAPAQETASQNAPIKSAEELSSSNQASDPPWDTWMVVGAVLLFLCLLLFYITRR